MNPDRCLVGIATIFERPSPNDGRSWSAEHFEQFLDSEMGIPLLVDHGPLINSWGVTPSVGTARWFAPVTYPVRGLLCLAEIDFADGWGDSILHDIDSILRQRWLPAVWGMSVGAYLTEDAVLPYEVSLTRRPAFEDARVLAVGADALATWELLTEAPNASVIQGAPAVEPDQGSSH